MPVNQVILEASINSTVELGMNREEICTKLEFSPLKLFGMRSKKTKIHQNPPMGFPLTTYKLQTTFLPFLITFLP